MTRTARIAVALLALTPGRASAQAPITNGADAPDDVSVVGLVYGGELRCSGTLVAPHVVLTAAHCVALEAPTAAVVVDGSGRRTDVPIAWTEHHPAFDAETLAADIGAAVLATAPDAPIAPLAESTVAEGAALRLVGFGRSGALARDEGARRQGSAVVDAVDALTLRYSPSPSQACIGDSGGPAFATIDGIERLVGVTSHGDSVCLSFGVETRADAYLAGFVQPVIDDADALCEDGDCRRADESGCSAAPGTGRPASWLPLALGALALAIRARSVRRARV